MDHTHAEKQSMNTCGTAVRQEPALHDLCTEPPKLCARSTQGTSDRNRRQPRERGRQHQVHRTATSTAKHDTSVELYSRLAGQVVFTYDVRSQILYADPIKYHIVTRGECGMTYFIHCLLPA